MRGRGAPMTYLSHNASFHSRENITPSNPGTKHLVPEHNPTPHDVARGLADLVPLRFQLREDDAFRLFSRSGALACIAARRDEARIEGLQGLAAPLSIAGADYMMHYMRGRDGRTVGHL
ncbi:hypothetical protein [Acetobacter sp. AAB5]